MMDPYSYRQGAKDFMVFLSLATEKDLNEIIHLPDMGSDPDPLDLMVGLYEALSDKKTQKKVAKKYPYARELMGRFLSTFGVVIKGG